MKNVILKEQMNEKIIDAVSKELSIDKDIASYLLSKGYSKQEIRALTLSDYADIEYEEITNIEEASDYFINFISKPEPVIYIRSDYDSDGVNSAFIAKDVIDSISIAAEKEIDTIIIDAERKDGYGINMSECIDIHADKRKNKMCMILDNGITKANCVCALNKRKIDVIVIDHHVPKTTIETPCENERCIIIDPWYNDKKNKNGKGLCAAALTFLFFKRVLAKLGDDTFINSYVGNAAVATITDCMPVTELNAMIVSNGIFALNRGEASEALNYYKIFKNCDVNPKDIAFELGPQLNACGRMHVTNEALKYLFSYEQEDIENNYDNIYKINKKRKDIENDILKDIDSYIDPNDKVVVAKLDKSASGILGSLASKILNKYQRPTILFFENYNTLKGSARSVPGISLHDLFNEENVAPYIINFGGHEQAAGIEIDAKNINNLKNELNKAFLKEKYSSAKSEEKVYEVDSFINLNYINDATMKKYDRILFFNDLKRPLVCLKDVQVISHRTSAKPENICFNLIDDSIKLRHTSKGDIGKELWGFGLANKYEQLNYPDKLTIVGRLGSMFGNTTLEIVDIFAE